MKIKKSRSKRKLLYVLLVLLLVATLFVAYFVFLKPNDSSNDLEINYEAPSDQQIDAGNDAKQRTIGEDQKSNDPKLNPPDAPTSNSPFTTEITTALVDVESGIVSIRNEISGIYQSGSCKLTLSKDGKTVEKTAGVQALPQSSTCKGFNIPVSQLSTGTWQIELEVTINGDTAKATDSIKV